MGTVAWTVVATEITSVGDWHTTQMCAHAQYDQPFRILNAVLGRKKNKFQMLKITALAGKLTESAWGSRREPVSTDFSTEISSAVL
jgi:hypothetical protein